MISYKILKKKIICSNNFKLKSLRSQDRYKIMRWRNEQMYHLRQTKKLTKKEFILNLPTQYDDEQLSDEFFIIIEKNNKRGKNTLAVDEIIFN